MKKNILKQTIDFVAAHSSKAHTYRIMALVVFSLFFANVAKANYRRVDGVNVGTQSAVVRYGSSGSVTYSITLSISNHTSGTGQSNDNLTLIWPNGTPTGVTSTVITANNGAYNQTNGSYTPSTTISFTVTINFNGTTPSGTSNFTITNVDHNPGGGTINITNNQFTVSKAPLTVAANDVTKTYGTAITGPGGGTTTGFTTNGLQNGESVSSVTITYGTGSAANSNAGTYNNQVIITAATGGTFNANNYTITYDNGNIIVNQAPLTITLTGPSRTYGSALSFFGGTTTSFTYTGALFGQTVTQVYYFTDFNGYTATANAGSTYNVYGFLVTGGTININNYNITFVQYTGTIQKASLTVKADDKAKNFGAVNPTLTVTYTGFVNGDNANDIDTPPTVSTTAVANSPIGTYPITASGGSDNNYNFTAYTPGTLTVGAATYDWVGTVSTDWYNPQNWLIGGSTQSASGNYPGSLGNTDVVRIAVVAYTNTANQPVLSSNLSNSIASLTIGNTEASTLTLGASTTLTLSGTLTFNTGSNFTLTGTNAGGLNIGTDFINNGGTFTNSSDGGIIISGVFTNTGTNNFGSPLVTFNNPTTNPGMPIVLTTSGTQTFANVLFTGQAHYQFRKSGAAAASFSISSTGVLTVAGSVNLTPASATLDLLSDANGSASVAPVPAGCTIGAVNVQRYIPGGAQGGHRGYKLLSSPVNYGTQDASGNNIVSVSYLTVNSFVTGTGGTAGGFNKLGNPSLYLYRENLAPLQTSFFNSNFRGMANITDPLNYQINSDPVNNDAGNWSIPVGNGYLFFFRGGSTTVNPYVTTTIPDPATLVASGNLNVGQVIVHDWYTPGSANLGYSTASSDVHVEGFNLIGNPYACTIDLETTNSTDKNTGIYASPNITGFAYELDPQTLNYGVYTIGGTIPPTNNASRYIVSGQGYFVQATSTGGQYIFNESAKSVGTQNTGATLLMGKPADLTANVQYMKVRMAMDSINKDETIISFGSSTKAQFDIKEDALYRAGTGKVSISSMSADNKALVVNRMPLDQKSIAIPLSVGATANGTYSLSMNSIKGIPQLYDIWLMDAYRKDSLDMRHNSTYRFDVIKTDSASFGANRFKLVLRQNPALAYHLLSFNAEKAQGKEVQLGWVTEHEENYTNFTVERSTDNGKTYTIVGDVAATGAGVYSFMDKTPGTNNLYRLKSEDYNGAITYSPIVPIGFSNLSNNLTSNNINVYPNPATSAVTLSINSAINTATTYNFKITNSYGLLIKQGTSTQANWQTNVSDLQPGTYVIQVVNTKDQSFVGKTKFVKL